MERLIRRHELIEPGGEVTCLVSGGPTRRASGTCSPSSGIACRRCTSTTGSVERSPRRTPVLPGALGAEVVVAPPAESEAALREIRYAYAPDRLRATGHTASDQVETVLYRLLSSGRPGGIKRRREDGIVRPLLRALARGDRAVLPRASASSRAGTRRTRRRHAGGSAASSCRCSRASSLARGRTCSRWRSRRAIRACRARSSGRCSTLLASTDGTSRRISVAASARFVNTTQLTLEHGPVTVGHWTIASDLPGLAVRRWRAGDRLAGRPGSAGRLHRREGAETAAHGLARRRPRGRGCRDPRNRGNSRGACRSHAGGRVSQTTELERGVGEVLIDADALRARVASWARRSRRLRRPRPAAGRACSRAPCSSWPT